MLHLLCVHHHIKVSFGTTLLLYYVMLNAEELGFTIAVALLAAVLIIWITLSTVVIITLSKAKVKVQNELKLANESEYI